jgi:UV excision repair protein RAD23
MKITIKTLQQKVFQIDADGADTVADLKKKIHDAQGHAVESQKLIYSGKVLPDEKSVEACEIREKDFLVLMVSKPKATPAASTSATPAPAPAPAPVPAQPPIVATPPPQPALTSVQPEVTAPPPPTAGDGSSFLSGEALQTSIQNMIEMGFPRDDVQRALRASFNNPERAVEYLMTGIPAHLEREMAAPAPAAQPAAVTSGNPPAATPAIAPAAVIPAAPVPAGGVAQNLFQLAQQQQQQRQTGVPGAAGPGGGSGGIPGIGGLPNPNQIQQLRQLLATNPEMAQHLIQQLAQNNPQLAQTLTEHPEALMQLLGEADEFGDDGEGGLPPGAQVVNVTEEERAAIERLEALGFSRMAAIQAYFACDKNEELAANMLFEGGFDDDS